MGGVDDPISSILTLRADSHYIAKDSGAYIRFGGGVIIILHKAEKMCMSCAHAPEGAWSR